MKFIWSLFALLQIACTDQNPYCLLVVKNDSKLRIDSIHVQMVDKLIKFGKLNQGDTLQQSFLKESVHAKHDVAFDFQVFVRDSVMIKEYVFSNDLGYVPDKTGVSITDSLRIVRIF